MSNRPSTPAGTREIFLTALEYDLPAERAQYLEQACGSNRRLRKAVEGLLRNHQSDEFLERPAADLSRIAKVREPRLECNIPSESQLPSEWIGPYRLLKRIGEGGVGTVYQAEQDKPVRRTVALKVLRPGMDSESVIARFETERQALAMMEHPNIARVLDAGTTGNGRPYFVMEMVRGVQITEYCDEHRMTTQGRLRLFVQVCHAIQHAHQKGIIHRDIKPSNILVSLQDGAPLPKVIDFGIAKALDQRLTNRTLVTEFHAFIGTPAYMSPEQAELGRLDIDTRTDVYSLGVLLYELLAGSTPFSTDVLISSGLDGMRRTIRESDPTPPSVRLQTIAEVEAATIALRQQSEPAKLCAQLRGDVDWIVLKALEKDRNRRYESPFDLALDIQRYLEDRPVVARPPGRFYRIQKMVRRNRVPFTAVGAFAVALMLGLILAGWQFREKSLAYERALQAEQRERLLREAAQQARITETMLRQQAEVQEQSARNRSYAADINLAQQALEMSNLGRATQLLNAQRPEVVPEGRATQDLRDWEWRYLWSETRSQALHSLGVMRREVTALSVAADDSMLAVSQMGGELALWDLSNRTEAENLPTSVGFGGAAGAVFSPTDTLIAFNMPDPTGFPSREQVQIRDYRDGRVLANLRLGGNCNGLAFSADGLTVATATGSGELVTWSVTTGQMLTIAHVLGKGAFTLPVRFSPDLTRAALGMEGGQLWMVDTQTGKAHWSAKAADETLRCMAFSADGKILASGAGFVESAIRLWDTRTGEGMGRLEGHRSWVSSLVFWPDNRTLASASADQTIRLWDLENLAPLDVLRGHQLEVWSLALSSDSRTLYSGSKDGSLLVWDVQLPRPDRWSVCIKLPDAIRSWRFSPESTSVLGLDIHGNVLRYGGANFNERSMLFELGHPPGWSAFSADAEYLVVNQRPGIYQVWSISEKRLLHEIVASRQGSFPVILMPLSNRLLTGQFGDHAFYEWDLVKGQLIRSWQSKPLPRAPRVFAVSPNERWFVAADEDGVARIRDLVADHEWTVDSELNQLSALVFSPDGRLLAAVSDSGKGGIWDTESAQRIASVQGFVLGMTSAAFSPGGNRLAIGSNGHEAVKIWDVGGANELLTLRGEGSLFVSVAFSPDGEKLAAANAQGILHIWHPPSEAAIERMEAQGVP